MGWGEDQAVPRAWSLQAALRTTEHMPMGEDPVANFPQKTAVTEQLTFRCALWASGKSWGDSLP